MHHQSWPGFCVRRYIFLERIGGGAPPRPPPPSGRGAGKAGAEAPPQLDGLNCPIPMTTKTAGKNKFHIKHHLVIFQAFSFLFFSLRQAAHLHWKISHLAVTAPFAPLIACTIGRPIFSKRKSPYGKAHVIMQWKIFRCMTAIAFFSVRKFSFWLRFLSWKWMICIFVVGWFYLEIQLIFFTIHIYIEISS